MRKLTEEEEEEIIRNVGKKLAEFRKKRREFKYFGRFQEVFNRVTQYVRHHGSLCNDEYQEPLLPQANDHIEPYVTYTQVSNEEFIEMVSLVLQENDDIRTQEDLNPFDNQVVRFAGFEFGAMHGQGTAFWVKNLEDGDGSSG